MTHLALAASVSSTPRQRACPKVVAALNPRGIHTRNTRDPKGGRIGHLTHAKGPWASSLFLRIGRTGYASSSTRQNSAMTSRALAPNLLTHLGHGRSPVCAASLRPNPCRIGFLRNLLGLQYGLPPSSGAKCTHGRWVLVGKDCMDHVNSVRGGDLSHWLFAVMPQDSNG